MAGKRRHKIEKSGVIPARNSLPSGPGSTDKGHAGFVPSRQSFVDFMVAISQHFDSGSDGHTGVALTVTDRHTESWQLERSAAFLHRRSGLSQATLSANAGKGDGQHQAKPPRGSSW